MPAFEGRNPRLGSAIRSSESSNLQEQAYLFRNIFEKHFPNELCPLGTQHRLQL